jgi:hypothetical protein
MTAPRRAKPRDLFYFKARERARARAAIRDGDFVYQSYARGEEWRVSYRGRAGRLTCAKRVTEKRLCRASDAKRGVLLYIPFAGKPDVNLS